MKKLFLSALALLMMASMFAQSTKEINNPFYEFRNSGITNISKIELSESETRVYVYNTFLPKWWIIFDKDCKLTDCDSGKTYAIKGIQGGEFGEKIWMPSTGDSTIVLLFPPLDKGVKQIDYGDDVFGISLDKQLEGMKPSYSPSLQINEWMNSEVSKCTQQPLEDFNSDDFFKEGTGKIVGCIKGYSPKSELATGIVYLSNYLTREDYPIVVEIQKDGRFELDLPLISPIYSYMKIGNSSIPFYLEQGQTLGMVLDWTDFLMADRLRDRKYVFKGTTFKGSLSTINRQLMNFDFAEMNYSKLRKVMKKMSLDQKVEFYDAQKDMELSKLDFYAKMKGINRKKAYLILKSSILLNYGDDILSLARSRCYDARKDTANKELQQPLPDTFYSFLSDIPLGDKALLVNSEFKSFVNCYEYCDIFRRQRKVAMDKVGSFPNFYDYLVEHETNLEDEDRAFAILTRKENKTEEEQIHIEKVKEDFKNLKDKYPEAYLSWKKIIASNNRMIESEIWSLAQNEFIEKYDIESNLTFDIAKVRSLKYRFKKADQESATAFWDTLKAGINNDFLIATGNRLFNEQFNDDANVAYELPQGTASDIFNKIIEAHKGKVLFIDFWATSCGPCVGSIKRMKETRKEYKGNKDFDFVFITNQRNSPEKKYTEFVEDQELINTYRISDSDYLYLRQLFKFNGIPHYVVIDKDGQVINDDFSMHNFKSELPKIVKPEYSTIQSKTISKL